MSFKNKVVIVTGSSSGIGASTAIQFAKEGAKVVITGRNETKLNNVVQQCRAFGNEPLSIKADVCNDADAKRIIKNTIDTFGKLDVLVNNAGTAVFASIIPEDAVTTYDYLQKVNLRSVIYLTSLAAEHLIKTKGNIVNISSIAGVNKPITNAVLYSVTKAGLDHYTKGAALEFSPYGVRVNSINPGLVVTDIIDKVGVPMTWDVLKEKTALKRVGEADEIADLVLFVASDRARSITGSVIVSDNGMLLL